MNSKLFFLEKSVTIPLQHSIRGEHLVEQIGYWLHVFVLHQNTWVLVPVPIAVAESGRLLQDLVLVVLGNNLNSQHPHLSLVHHWLLQTFGSQISIYSLCQLSLKSNQTLDYNTTFKNKTRVQVFVLCLHFKHISALGSCPLLGPDLGGR